MPVFVKMVHLLFSFSIIYREFLLLHYLSAFLVGSVGPVSRETTWRLIAKRWAIVPVACLSPACFHCLTLSGKLGTKKKNESELNDSFKEVILLSHVAMTDGLTFGRSHELSSTPWGGHCCCHHVGYLLLWAPFLISLMNVLFLFFFMTSRPSNN